MNSIIYVYSNRSTQAE